MRRKVTNNDLDKMMEEVSGVTSAHESTGLMPWGPKTHEEHDNMMSLTKFSPKDIKHS